MYRFEFTICYLIFITWTGLQEPQVILFFFSIHYSSCILTLIFSFFRTFSVWLNIWRVYFTWIYFAWDNRRFFIYVLFQTKNAEIPWFNLVYINRLSSLLQRWETLKFWFLISLSFLNFQMNLIIIIAVYNVFLNLFFF